MRFASLRELTRFRGPNAVASGRPPFPRGLGLPESGASRDRGSCALWWRDLEQAFEPSQEGLPERRGLRADHDGEGVITAHPTSLPRNPAGGW